VLAVPSAILVKSKNVLFVWREEKTKQIFAGALENLIDLID
jgi:hypothetical protein